MALKKMAARPAPEPEKIQRENKLFRLNPALGRAFDILKAEQGPHSGPRLADEALTLLLKKYGKPVPHP
jgi:hypothetical protein